VNQDKGRYGPHGTSLWSSRSWIPDTKRTHKPRNTTAHKVKLEALSQLDVEACVSERTYYRTVHSTVWGWIYYRTIRSSRLEDKTHQWGGWVLLACLVVNYLFTTQGHYDIISSDTTMLSLCVVVVRRDVLVSTDYTECCITCARIIVLLLIILCEHVWAPLNHRFWTFNWFTNLELSHVQN
jgi:hypothetical protein